MVGNGVTDYRFDNELALFEMAFWYGFMSSDDYFNIKEFCLGDNPPNSCDTWISNAEASLKNINLYDAFGKCYTNPSSLEHLSLYEGKASGLYRTGNEIKAFKRYYTAGDLTPFLKNPLGSKLGGKLKLIPDCVYAKPLLDYMNDPTVKAALHIGVSAPMWDLCNADINTNYVRSPAGSIDVYVELRKKYRMLKYSGDTDMAVPTYGTRDWIDNLAWPISKEWKQFFVNGQVGGYSETRDDGNFVFATIHGAGHMAPQWRRGPTYHVIFNFVNSKAI